MASRIAFATTANQKMLSYLWFCREPAFLVTTLLNVVSANELSAIFSPLRRASMYCIDSVFVSRGVIFDPCRSISEPAEYRTLLRNSEVRPSGAKEIRPRVFRRDCSIIVPFWCAIHECFSSSLGLLRRYYFRFVVETSWRRKDEYVCDTSLLTRVESDAHYNARLELRCSNVQFKR